MCIRIPKLKMLNQLKCSLYLFCTLYNGFKYFFYNPILHRYSLEQRKSLKICKEWMFSLNNGVFLNTNAQEYRAKGKSQQRSMAKHSLKNKIENCS